jgi:hypothetical protein
MDGGNIEIAPMSDLEFNLKIDDVRQDKKDITSQFALSERLKADKVDIALSQAYKFLGQYSICKPQDLSAQLIDGNIGEGTIKGTIIELQLPDREQIISELKGFMEPLLNGETEEIKDNIVNQLAITITASTALHEGVHGLLDSRPGSKFSLDFEEVTGFTNERGVESTLLDEGIAYAIQSIYAPNFESIGSLAPFVKESDNAVVKQRKILGEKLSPVVKEYIDNEKSIDNNFFEIAKESMIHL